MVVEPKILAFGDHKHPPESQLGVGKGPAFDYRVRPCGQHST